MTQPLVSIVMPTYNDIEHLDKTVNSVLSQSYRDFELLIVDDCSNDGTWDHLQKYPDVRIRLFRNEHNSGAAVTRNRGVDEARGRYIAFIDSDDVWREDKLSIQINAMKEKDLSFVYSKYYLINERDEIFGESGNLSRETNYNKLLKHCIIRTSSVVYDTEKCGGKHKFPLIRRRQDFGMFLSLLKSTPVAHLVDDYLCSYRIRRGSVSSTKRKNIPYQWAIYIEVEKLGVVRSSYLMVIWFLSAGFTNISRKFAELSKDIKAA